MGEPGIIVTGVDKLIKMLKDQSMVTVSAAAKSLGVSTRTVEDWVSFLEEEDVVKVTYKLATPYISLKKVTETQINKKAGKLEQHKDIFVRKAENMLSFLDREGEELNQIRDEFMSLKKSIGENAEHVQAEILELEKYEKAKRDVDAKIESQRKEVVQKIKNMDNDIDRQQKRYLSIIKEVEDEEKRIQKEERSASEMQKLEGNLRKKISEFREMIATLEGRIDTEKSGIADSEKHISRLKQTAAEVHKTLEHEKEELMVLIKESKKMEQQVLDAQDSVLKNLSRRMKDSNDLRKVTKDFRALFAKKNQVEELIKKINLDRNDLENDLHALIKRIKSVQIMKNAAESDAEIRNLFNLFGLIDKKKKVFESEIHQLGQVMKKKR